MRSLYNRRTIIPILVALLLTLLIPLTIALLPYLVARDRAGNGELDLVQYVNPFIGTEAAVANRRLGTGFDNGNVFPGAVFPRGMVQWSPDTTDAAGGYRYDQSVIKGFSLTHFSGRGCSAYQDFPFMPAIGLRSPFHFSTYAASFSHGNETASPGYYSVHLTSTDTQVSLTVTARTGFGVFTYPRSKLAMLLINAGGSATGNADTGTGVQIVGTNQVTGSATSGRFCGRANTYTIYFAATFDRPFTSFGTWNGSTVTPGSYSSKGSKSGAYLSFDTTQNQVVRVKVGLSFVSVANAQANVESENPGWDFNAVREKASAAWNTKLNEIQVFGGTFDQKKIFYTALYHTLLHPNVFSDVNGQYIGFDKRIHTAHGYTQYENFPGWDMYRSLIALQALLEPREVGDMLQSLVVDAQQGGGGLPRWEVANDNSGGMVGDSMDAVIATSYTFGVRNFDALGALEAMDKGASQANTRSGRYIVREGLSDYLKLGYVSTRTPGSAAITLEYAIDDFAIAQFARALGKMNLYNTYIARAQNWQKLYNPKTGYIEARNPDGTFLSGFSPTSQKGFVEGNAAQYTWLVPYNLPGLFKEMGGYTKVIQRLDKHFTQLNAGSTSPNAFMGNEPELEVPWEYDFAGAPYRTQDVVRRIETQLFKATPDGLGGNDDGGALSSWYVFAAIGLYPEIPGVAGFAVGSPLFPMIRVHLGNGNQLQISGQGASDTARYVQSLSINGHHYNSSWVPFELIMKGGGIWFVLGEQPPQP